MKERPECAVEGCKNPGWVLFGDKWICGECVSAYDKKVKEQNFTQLQEMIKNAD